MSYMAADARYTANYTQHSRYTTRNTTRYTTRNTTDGSISGQDRKTDLYFHFIPSKHESSKMLPLPAVRECCVRVVLRGAATQQCSV